MASKRFDLPLVHYFWTHKAKGFFKGFFPKSYVLKKSWYVNVATRGGKAGVINVINGRAKPGKTVH